ncbi:MAG: S41 family peptidase [Bacteroidota bacterium]
MKHIAIYALLVGLLCCTACAKDFEFSESSKVEVFETMWTHIDQNYPFFELKGIDWDAIRTTYTSRLANVRSEFVLFDFCTDLLFELEDGHGVIADGSQTISYNYTQGFDVLFDLGIARADYLNNDYRVIRGTITYGIIQDSIGYVHYSNMRGAADFAPVWDAFLEADVQKVIIDVRSNPGGQIGNGVEIVGYLSETETLVGYQVQKGGPGRNDFTELLPLTTRPKANSKAIRTKVLINRGSYSAATMFAGMARSLPYVEIIGQISGGGAGGGQSFELPNGWVIDIPQGFYLDAEQNHVELGLEPDFPINNTLEDLQIRRDVMLEAAIER